MTRRRTEGSTRLREEISRMGSETPRSPCHEGRGAMSRKEGGG